MDELLTKHQKERRDLQSRVTQKKKNATKRTRKGVNDECEALERELKERQKAELDALNGDEVADGVNGLILDDQAGDFPAHQAEEASAARPPSPGTSTTSSAPAGPKKRNRQKDRLARRAAEQDAAIAAAEEEAANMPDQREVELKAMAEHTSRLGLTEIPIRPDGHCLFAAIATSLSASTVESGSGYQNVRSVAAEFIATHPDDFSAFLEEPIESYTKKIKDTAEWGGAVELQALSKALGRRINVVQSDGRVERIGEGEEIWLAYYRHSFGLGEHYNALKKKREV
jgi:OTU domain-containing protein 6